MAMRKAVKTNIVILQHTNCSSDQLSSWSTDYDDYPLEKVRKSSNVSLKSKEKEIEL